MQSSLSDSMRAPIYRNMIFVERFATTVIQPRMASVGRPIATSEIHSAGAQTERSGARNDRVAYGSHPKTLQPFRSNDDPGKNQNQVGEKTHPHGLAESRDLITLRHHQTQQPLTVRLDSKPVDDQLNRLDRAHKENRG